MRILFGIAFIISGICGVFVGIMSDIIIDSSLYVIDGIDLSLGLALFSIVVFFNGMYQLFIPNN
jgi:hypothetical protein